MKQVWIGFALQLKNYQLCARFLDGYRELPLVRALWETGVWVDERRYPSAGRRERLTAVVRVLGMAETVTRRPRHGGAGVVAQADE